MTMKIISTKNKNKISTEKLHGESNALYSRK